jgi:hypothetical protein
MKAARNSNSPIFDKRGLTTDCRAVPAPSEVAATFMENTDPKP